MIDDDPDALGSWNPPYVDLVAEEKAMREWLNYHPDDVPPWIVDEQSAHEARTRVEVAPVVERSFVREAAAPDAAVTEPGPVSLPPPPLPIGTRVDFLSSEVSAYGRGLVARGSIIRWDGVAFEIMVGHRDPIRVDPSRVSALDPFGRPTHPERVCWTRGDELPLLPKPAPGAPTSTQPEREMLTEPAPSSVVVPGANYVGMFPCAEPT